MIILTDPSIDGRQHLLVVAGIVLFTVLSIGVVYAVL